MKHRLAAILLLWPFAAAAQGLPGGTAGGAPGTPAVVYPDATSTVPDAAPIVATPLPPPPGASAAPPAAPGPTPPSGSGPAPAAVPGTPVTGAAPAAGPAAGASGTPAAPGTTTATPSPGTGGPASTATTPAAAPPRAATGQGTAAGEGTHPPAAPAAGAPPGPPAGASAAAAPGASSPGTSSPGASPAGAAPGATPGPAAPADTGTPLPDTWLPQGTAVLQVLNKETAIARTLTVAVGQAVQVGSLTITVRACVVRPTTMPADAAAFLGVAGSGPDAPGFQGWTLENEPSLSMFQGPLYNVRVLGCRA